MVDFFKKYITANNIVFLIITLFLLYFVAHIKDIAILFFASYVISCSLNPLVDIIISKTKIKRSFASAIVLVTTMILILLFIIPAVVMGGHQIKSFVHLLPNHIESIRTYLLSLPFFDIGQINKSDMGGFVSSVPDITSNILSKSINVSVEIMSGLIYFLAACIIVYYFMSDKDTIRKGYLSLFPHNMKKRANEIMDSISQKIGGYVIAQISTMASAGLIITIGLTILKVDYALLLGILTGILDIIPIVGPTIALIIILITVYKLSMLKIGLIILVFAFAQWAENNLVRPYIFSKFMDLHPLIIYFFLFVTAQFLGIIGVIFAPAIAASVCVLFEELYIKSIN